jgi:hypothetical protein
MTTLKKKGDKTPNFSRSRRKSHQLADCYSGKKISRFFFIQKQIRRDVLLKLDLRDNFDQRFQANNYAC